MQAYNFISILIVVTLIIGLIELFKINRRTRLLNYLTAYFLIAFIMFTVGHYQLLKIYIHNNNLLLRIMFELINTIFSLFELLFFTSFIESQNKNKEKSIIRKFPYFYIMLLLFTLLYASIYKLNKSSITNTSVLFNIIEFAFLLFLCLRFFYDILQNPLYTPTISKGKLQIVSSLFIYISISLPLLIISEKINKTYNYIYTTIYLIHYVVLCIVFVSITTALKKQKSIFYA